MEKFRKRSKNEFDQKEKKTVTRYAPDYHEGLSEKIVAERIQDHATNQTIDTSFKSNKEIVFQNTFTYFNLIFMVLAILLCLVGSYKNLTFLPVILANTGIAIYQEIRSKKSWTI